MICLRVIKFYWWSFIENKPTFGPDWHAKVEVENLETFLKLLWVARSRKLP